jgi:hypothetical protein
MPDIDEIAVCIAELNEGMTLDERILWFRGSLGLEAANLLIAEARNLLIQRHAEAVAAARADRRALGDYLFLLRANERAERAEWLDERAQDEIETAMREGRREDHQIEAYLRRVRNDRAYYARLRADLDFDEVEEMQQREKRDLDDFWVLLIAIVVARLLQTRTVRREQFTRFVAPAPSGSAPALPAPDADQPRVGM